MILRPTDPWLTTVEQEAVCDAFLHYNLIKFSDMPTLPLKSGGKTDIYVNQRNARAVPGAEASKYLGKIYANPLQRLGLDGFAEVPDAVSCFAPYVAEYTGLPQVTVRGEQKQDRATGGTFVGDVNLPFGSSVDIFDDVITDGASKIPAYLALKDKGYNVNNIVVLVNRQQGWKKNFEKNGIPLNVWAGMTLHDLRRMLIQRKILKNPVPDPNETKGLIVALDGIDFETALPVLEQLRGSGVILKANDLAARYGTDWILLNLSVYGRIMLDLKWHDIPNTLENFGKLLLRYPPWAITVHASGGKPSLEAIVKFVKHHNLPTKVLGVTLLTSLDGESAEEIYVSQSGHTVDRLAKIAVNTGVDGLVCSPQEVASLKAQCSGKILVTPGIRTEGAAKDDQSRVATPEGAMDAGANYLVVGRPIMQAEDPAKAAKGLRDRI